MSFFPDVIMYYNQTLQQYEENEILLMKFHYQLRSFYQYCTNVMFKENEYHTNEAFKDKSNADNEDVVVNKHGGLKNIDGKIYNEDAEENKEPDDNLSMYSTSDYRSEDSEYFTASYEAPKVPTLANSGGIDGRDTSKETAITDFIESPLKKEVRCIPIIHFI